MGFTRFYNYKKSEECFPAFPKEFLTYVQELILDAWENKHIKICGEDGTGTPTVNPFYIGLNGDASIGADHESFILDWNDCYEYRRYRTDPSFDFCKTACKPYDYVVRNILKKALEFGILESYESDEGYEDEEVIFMKPAEDPEYDQAIRYICKKEFEYPFNGTPFAEEERSYGPLPEDSPSYITYYHDSDYVYRYLRPERKPGQTDEEYRSCLWEELRKGFRRELTSITLLKYKVSPVDAFEAGQNFDAMSYIFGALYEKADGIPFDLATITQLFDKVNILSELARVMRMYGVGPEDIVEEVKKAIKYLPTEEEWIRRKNEIVSTPFH